MSLNFGIKDLAKKTSGAHIGIKDVEHKILKMYIGVDNKAELYYGASGGGNENSLYLYRNGVLDDSLGEWSYGFRSTGSENLCDFQFKSDCIYWHNEEASGDEILFWCANQQSIGTVYSVYSKLCVKYECSGEPDAIVGLCSTNNVSTGGIGISGERIIKSTNGVNVTNYKDILSTDDDRYLGIHIPYIYGETTLKIKEIWLE